jgi:hypothetical protein
MQSPELTPTPSAKVFLPPDPPTTTSELQLSEACEKTGARDDLLGERSVTASPVVIVPLERPQGPRWPAFVIALALLLSLLWSAALVWLIYLLLSALSIVSCRRSMSDSASKLGVHATIIPNRNH